MVRELSTQCRSDPDEFSSAMQRWNETVSRGLAEAAGLTNDVSVACLQGWCSSAAANLKLAAALKGTPSQGESLEAVLNAAVTRLDNGQAHLKRCAAAPVFSSKGLCCCRGSPCHGLTADLDCKHLDVSADISHN